MTRILAAAALLASLAACNTVQGVGRDISAGGAAITGAAARTVPVRRVPAQVRTPHYHY